MGVEICTITLPLVTRLQRALYDHHLLIYILQAVFPLKAPVLIQKTCQFTLKRNRPRCIMHALRRFHRLVVLLANHAPDRRNAPRPVMFVEHVHRVAAGVQGVALAGVEGVTTAVPEAFGLGCAFIDGPLRDARRCHACAGRQASSVVGRL